MKFEFAKATDITNVNFVKELYPDYERIYITPDVNDYHILRILKGYDEGYKKNPDMYILEHQMIPKPKGEVISGLNKLRLILEEDDGGNYDYKAYNSLEACIDVVDGGYGIN